MSSVAQSISMDREAVASELGISTVEVSRLIAKRALPATRIAGGPWRVLPESVSAFIKRGAPGAKLPDYKEPAGWLDDDHVRNLAGAFETAIVDAGQEQVKPEADVRAAFEREPLRTSGEFTLDVTGKVAEVLKRPTPVSAFAPSNEQRDARLSSWSDAWAISTLHRVAYDIIQAKNLATAPISTLFADPETFNQIVDEAYRTAAQRKVAVFSRFHSYVGDPFGPVPVERRTFYSLPADVILTPSARERLLALAF